MIQKLWYASQSLNRWHTAKVHSTCLVVPKPYDINNFIIDLTTQAKICLKWLLNHDNAIDSFMELTLAVDTGIILAYAITTVTIGWAWYQ